MGHHVLEEVPASVFRDLDTGAVVVAYLVWSARGAAVVVAAAVGGPGPGMPVAQLRLACRACLARPGLGEAQQMELVGDLLGVHLVHRPDVVHEVGGAEPAVGLHKEVGGVHEGLGAGGLADDEADQEGEGGLDGGHDSVRGIRFSMRDLFGELRMYGDGWSLHGCLATYHGPETRPDQMASPPLPCWMLSGDPE